MKNEKQKEDKRKKTKLLDGPPGVAGLGAQNINLSLGDCQRGQGVG